MRTFDTAQAGFSFVELLTAMGIASILMLAAAPQLPTYWAQLQIANAARQVAMDLHRARMKAVGENAFCRVVFNSDNTYLRQSSPDGATFAADGAVSALPKGIRFTGGLPQPTFNRLGTTGADAAVTLVNSLGKTKSVQVNALGNIAIP
jgi:prepilin-type N-terminal cleavage/methylation domain-containing protein